MNGDLPDSADTRFLQNLRIARRHVRQRPGEAELACRARQAMAQLPMLDREILLMWTFEGLSCKEVAFLLGIEPDAARRRHGRALLRFHQILAEVSR
jgi:DNA-directed RNA polymerase specialized sigma24 family protein